MVCSLWSVIHSFFASTSRSNGTARRTKRVAGLRDHDSRRPLFVPLFRVDAEMFLRRVLRTLARLVEIKGPWDLRADSVNPVASAVGEGAMAVQFVHEYLKEM